MNRYQIPLLLALLVLAAAAEGQSLSPLEARKKVGEAIAVEMTVLAAKDRLEKRGEIYLDADPDFHSNKNFAVVINKKGAASLKAAGIAAAADHFRNKKIRATGSVKEVDKIPRIEVDDARQIRIVETAAPPAAVADALNRIKELGGRASLDPSGQEVAQVYLAGTGASDADLAWLAKLPALTELSLASTRITDAGLPQLAKLKKLDAIHLAGNPISDQGVAALADLTQLQLLGLKGTRVSDAGLVHLTRMQNLQWLGLRSTKVTDAGLAHLQKIPQLPGVSLSFCQVTDAGLAHLAALTHMQRLVLDHTRISNAGLAYLKGMAELHTLDLAHTQIGDSGLKHLAGLPRLQMLELNGTRITDDGLAQLAELTRLKKPGQEKTEPIVPGAIPPQGLPPLPGLGLGETQIGDAGLKHLADLRGIQRLDLSKTRITDSGLEHLLSLSELRALDLRGTAVTDAGVKYLTRLSKLQFFDGRGSRITAGGLAELKKALPRCHVVVGANSDSNRNTTAAAKFYPGFTGYTRKVTTESAEAQKWFDQGIQLLYGFNHDEAIRSFEKAGQIDPDCAMAWWGSAYARGLHINNPEMGEEQSRLAHEAAEKARKVLDNETPVEKALVLAVGQRYTWPAPKDRKPLDQAYADAMEKAWHQFPDDADVGALFAESLMNLQPWDLWTAEAAPKGRALEIVAVLERTLAKTPNHPGANHFYIHAIEASPWPQRGAEVADRLSSLVTGSGHLVHMPAHIYIRTGRYADAVASNQKAIKADEAYFATAPKPDFYNIYFMHNVHFLAYSAMMEARYEVAMEAARKLERIVPPDFLKAQAVIADGFMPTKLHVMIRFGRWKDVLAEPEPEAWRLVSRAERHAARAVALAALGRTKDGRQELEMLDKTAKELTDAWKVGNNSAIEVVAIARMMADGELLYREGSAERAFEVLRAAIKREENLKYDEPPGWMQPIRHALGALLLADGRSAEAESVYRADLVRHPNNAWSLLGLEQALRKQGNKQEADALAPKVRLAWARADVPPVASCYCHPEARGK